MIRAAFFSASGQILPRQCQRVAGATPRAKARGLADLLCRQRFQVTLQSFQPWGQSRTPECIQTNLGRSENGLEWPARRDRARKNCAEVLVKRSLKSNLIRIYAFCGAALALALVAGSPFIAAGMALAQEKTEPQQPDQ